MTHHVLSSHNDGAVSEPTRWSPPRVDTDHGPGRLNSFSDGVMAVIITIMAFDLRPPAGSSFAALTHRLPNLLIYVLSFVSIGIYWNNHHHLLRATERINGAVMWANLHLLFWLSLLPVLTEWVATNYRHTAPAVCYCSLTFAAANAYYLLVRTLVAANPPESTVAVALSDDRKGIASTAIYALGIGLGFASPYATYACVVLVAALWLIPDRRLARASAAAAHDGGVTPPPG
jgi:uncharacterized membrane protein